MGKIYDALEKMNSERTSFEPPSRIGTTQEHEDTPPGEKDFRDMIAQVSDTQKRPDRDLVTLLDPRSFEAEQFKILRTSILFPATGTPPKVIMITSAVPGEGKSFVASNLAASISQNIDDHVLLMDCDLRLPTIHTFFGIEGRIGLSEYLSGGVELSSLFVKTGSNKLSVMTGGTPPANPSELLSSEQMSKLIQEVKTRYNDRYIIIDSAPPRYTAESSALAKYADAIVLVVSSGSTNRDAILELVNILGKDKILGVVLNRHNFRSSNLYDYGTGKKYK